MTGCSSSRHQRLLLDSNPGPAGYKPSVLTTKTMLLPFVIIKLEFRRELILLLFIIKY